MTVKTLRDSQHCLWGAPTAPAWEAAGRCPPRGPLASLGSFVVTKDGSQKRVKYTARRQKWWTLTHHRKGQTWGHSGSSGGAFKLGQAKRERSESHKVWNERRSLPGEDSGRADGTVKDLPSQRGFMRDGWSRTVTGNAKLQTSAFLKHRTSEWHTLKLARFGNERQDYVFLGGFKGSGTQRGQKSDIILNLYHL